MILSIESSCDEFSAALVTSDFEVKKNILFSSADVAKKTGGVVPEIAAREAADQVVSVLEKTLQNIDKNLNFDWDSVDAIAVTNGPGLVGSLLVGIETAKTLAFIHEKPLIPVYHIFGHMCANMLWEGDIQKPDNHIYPKVILTVSGGHNDIYLWKSPLEYEKIATKIDDAGGECFDKCARMLGLGYPGGPALSRLAEKGNRDAFDFPKPLNNKNDFRFSFSGLKTSVLYKIRDLGGIENIDEPTKADLAASIEWTIVCVLLKKLFAVADKYKVSHVEITGGVSANRVLREEFAEQATKKNYSFSLAQKIIYCTDNAAMIGAAAQIIWQYDEKDGKQEYDFKNVKVNF